MRRRPLTGAETNSMNAWKCRYLRRLRAEKTDESYIDAYLKAWNLDARDVFGRTNAPQYLKRERDVDT